MKGFGLRRLIPSPATVVSVIALLFAMTGGAIAASNVNKDEVTITTSSQTVTIYGPDMSDPDYPNNFTLVPMQFPSVTQKAGEAVQLIAKMSHIGPDQEDENAPCEQRVELYTEAFGAAEMRDYFQRGPSPLTFVVGIPASNVDQNHGPITMMASAVGGATGPLFACDSTDSFQVTVTLSVVRFRN